MGDKVRATFYISNETKEKIRKYSYLANKKYAEFMDNVINYGIDKLLHELEEKEEK